MGGLVTASSVGGWYQGLHRPSFNPPDQIFAPVWTILFVLMAIAGWRIWRATGSVHRRTALILFAVQLGLNLLWSVLFFGLQRIDLALAEILVLLILIATTTLRFWRIDVLAGAMFVPYLLWVGYASVLNAALWVLNPG